MTRFAKRLVRDDSGAVALTVALSMIVLLGIAALSLDGGRGMTEKREVQNAADHAALIAAWASCQVEDASPGDAEAAGLAAGAASALENGYDGVTDNTVTITRVASAPDVHTYSADISSTIDGTFSATIGVPTLDVGGYAEATCEWVTGPGQYAIFAGAPGCGPTELSITGSSQNIIGGIHSNGELMINGNTASPSNIYGPVSYVEDIALSGVNLWQEAAPPGITEGFPFVTPIQPFPVSFNIDDYAPTGARAVVAGADYYDFVGNENWSGVTLDEGLYYVDGNLRMHDIEGERVTIVATGEITLNGVNLVNTNPAIPATAPWEPSGLSLFSNNDASGPACNAKGITWSSSNSTWGGIQYAPNGSIDMSAASNNTIDGSIIAYTVNLSGSSINFTNSNAGAGTDLAKLELDE